MVRPEYTRIPTDAISDDSSIIDFDNVQNRNTGLDNDDYVSDYDMQLLANNTNTINTTNTTRNIRSARIQPIPFTNSSLMRNAITKKLYCNIIIINIIAVIPFVLTIYGYIEMKNASGIDIYNLGSEYMYYYFFAIMLFYTFYISTSFIILILTFCLNINSASSMFALLVNNMIFQINMSLRMIVIAILAVQMIENTPMNIITIDKANPPTQIEVYIPKHIQYMIIEIGRASCRERVCYSV
jgi:hypothetical protein